MEELVVRGGALVRRRERLRWGLLLAAGALLALALLRPGLAVTVGGEELGVYDPRQVARRLDTAEALAGELLGERVDLRSSVEMRLSFAPAGWSRDYRLLERALLDQAPGLARLWLVKAGEATVGPVDDPSVLGELVAVLVGQHAGPYTVSARVEPELTLRRCYVREAEVLTPEELSARLRAVLTVETRELSAAQSPDGLSPQEK